MRVAIIGRSEILFDTAVHLRLAGHDVVCVVTSKAAPEYTRTSDDFEQLARESGAHFVLSSRLTAHLATIKSTNAEVGISMNHPGILGVDALEQFPHGVLNAHGGDLPRYRGNACQAWAILNGERRIGLCVHRMVADELDNGDILARTYLPIDATTKVTQVWTWMNTFVPLLFETALERLTDDPAFVLDRQSQDPRAALRCYPRRPEDGRIDWTMEAIGVLRLVNASNRPYSGAFTSSEGRTMTIWDAEIVLDDERFCAIPGQVTKIGGGSIDVACGVGKIRINEAQIGDRVAAPATWIKSLRSRLI